MKRNALLVCGIVSSVLYVAMNIVAPMQWDAYSSTSQTVSELSAIGAPTRWLWIVLAIPYTLLLAAFGWGVRASAGRNRHLVVTGNLLLIYGLIGLGWPPMHPREALAAGGATLFIAILFTFGTLTGLDAPKIDANLPTPWIGVWERINIGAFTLWVIVLAVTVLRQCTIDVERSAASQAEEQHQ